MNETELKTLRKSLKKVEFKISFDPDDYPDGAIAEILAFSGRIKSCIESCKKSKKALEQKTKEIQEKCNCPADKREAVMIENPYYSNLFIQGLESLKKIFSGSKCSVCKKSTPTKAGSRYSVCSKCGSDMKSDGYVQLQGMREHFYTCSSKTCFHKESHT